MSRQKCVRRVSEGYGPRKLDYAGAPDVGIDARSPIVTCLAGTRAVVVGTIELARDSWKPHAAALFAQLQKASSPVQLNIAEGYAFGESPAYTRHLRIAYGSAVETGELLEVALKSNVVAVDIGTRLLARNRRSQRLLLGMLHRRKRVQG